MEEGGAAERESRQRLPEGVHRDVAVDLALADWPVAVPTDAHWPAAVGETVIWLAPPLLSLLERVLKWEGGAAE